MKDSDNVEKKEEEPKPTLIPMSKLFAYADKRDVISMIVGSICATALGAITPLISVILGRVINAFLAYGQVLTMVASGVPIPPEQIQTARDDVETQVIQNVLLFVYIGIGGFAAAYLMQMLWTVSGERQAQRVRKLFLTSILNQDTTFFDANETGDLTTRLSSDTVLYQEGISEKVGLTVSYFSTFFTGFIIAFIEGWKLTLVLVACFPLLMVAGVLVGKAIASGVESSQAAYGKAGAIAQESLANIRTVIAFNGQDRAVAKFDKLLDKALKLNEVKSWKMGLGFGVFFGALFGFYAVAFYYGSILAFNGELEGGDVLNVVFAIIIGAFSLINLGPSLQAINKARGVAGKLFQVIESKPMIPSKNPDGKRLDKVKGKIEFKNVTFEYPTRPGVPVLRGLDMVVEPGQTVAIVGHSGSGKSTVIQLLQRFYDPLSGEILIDGVPLNTFDIEWLRSQTGLVSQEPILFDLTIEENIKLGNVAAVITDEEVKRVAEASNAYSFIKNLPQQFKTRAGERGSLLSGGQKQRCAIARALLKNPAILLLDEATSALDSSSERIVQEALDNASKDRTTIVIAHRLSTVKNADVIVVMDAGRIVETGTHEELIAKQGQYYQLVRAQEVKKEVVDDSEVVAENKDSVKVVATVDEKVVIAVETKVVDKEEETDEQRIAREDREILKNNKTPLFDIIKMQRPEIGYLILGLISLALNGALLPLVGTLLGEVLAVFSRTGQDLLDGARYWSLVFMSFMFLQFFGYLGQFGGFGVSGERLTRRIRANMFRAMLRMEVSFFNDPKHGTGALTAKLSTEADRIQGLTGPVLGNLFQLLVSIVLSLSLAFWYSWDMTLVVLGALPVLVAASAIEAKTTLAASNNPESKDAYAKASQTACDAIANIRTIKSFNIQDKFVREYMSSIDVPYKLGLRRGYLGSIGYGLSQGVQFWIYALAFYAGYRFVFEGIIEPRDLFTVFFTIIFGAISFSSAAAFGPNVTKARVAAINYFQLVNRQSAIDSSSFEGDKPTDVSGQANLEKAEFSYPQRLDVPILKGVSLDIKPGQSVALVGPTGSGKSTVIALLERFYDPSKGVVNVESKDVKKWNVSYLRDQMSIVSQEPNLFIGTIMENIKYGRPIATDEEAIAVAKMANIHAFIDSLPLKYETEVSSNQLSGGQKQRVSIARAMLRSPRILLLDEPTSALDSESEKAVQDALAKVCEGGKLTTISIAHRLSSIQNSDVIFVLQDGEVVEQGTHNELLGKKGVYHALVEKQKLGTE